MWRRLKNLWRLSDMDEYYIVPDDMKTSTPFKVVATNPSRQAVIIKKKVDPIKEILHED